MTDKYLQNLLRVTGTVPSDQIRNYFESSPITTIHIASGITLHLADLLGIIPSRSLLFHPRLVLSPYWQSYRAVTSFFVIGLGTIDVIQRAIGATYYQAPLESWFSGKGDVYRNGKLIHPGHQRKKLGSATDDEGRGRKTVVEWLITTNPFLKAQVITMATLVAIELVVSEVPGLSMILGSSSSSSGYVFPYTMFLNLEYATRWVWALTTNEKEVVMFGVVPVKPVYLPLVLCAAGGFGQWKALVKGFVASLVVGRVLQLKRMDGDGVVEWTLALINDWYLWFKEMSDAYAASDVKGKKPEKKAGKSFLNGSTSINAELLDDPDFYRPYSVPSTSG